MTRMRAASRTAVYPRVGGGNSVQAISSRIKRGLSPRGRGKPTAWMASVLKFRSIPAWAGETPTKRWGYAAE